MSAQPSRRSEQGNPDQSAVRTVARDGGGRLAYTTVGARDGTPAVAFHGTPGSRLFGRLLADHATRNDVSLHAFDRPGYGRSPPDPARSVRSTAALLPELLDDAGVASAALIAFSGGAPYALAAAEQVPERVRRVDVVAGATPASLHDQTPRPQRLLSAMATRTPRLLAGSFRFQRWLAERGPSSLVLGQYTGDPASVPEPAASAVVAEFVEAFSNHREGAVTEFRHTREPWGVEFDEIRVPVVFRHGTADSNVPIEGVRRLADRIPDASLDVVEGADHLQSLLRTRADAVGAIGDEADD